MGRKEALICFCAIFTWSRYVEGSDEPVINGRRCFVAEAKRNRRSSHDLGFRRYPGFTRGFLTRGLKSYRDVVLVKHMAGNGRMKSWKALVRTVLWLAADWI